MITAKTESGFSIELEDDALEDQELFDAISGMQDGNVFSMSHLTERLLGTEGRKKLYDHLRNDKGRVPPQAVAQALNELLTSFSAGKKLCILAELIASDEDALICDFAQYYHVLDWRSLPLRLAATLAAGLPEDSRSMMKASGKTVPLHIELQAYTADRLTQILWGLSNDTRTVPSVLADLHGLSADSDTDVQSYDSPEEFEAALAALKGGG